MSDEERGRFVCGGECETAEGAKSVAVAVLRADILFSSES